MNCYILQELILISNTAAGFWKQLANLVNIWQLFALLVYKSDTILN